MTEHNPAPSPSGHPLLSGPPTLTDAKKIFTNCLQYYTPVSHGVRQKSWCSSKVKSAGDSPARRKAFSSCNRIYLHSSEPLRNSSSLLATTNRSQRQNPATERTSSMCRRVHLRAHRASRQACLHAPVYATPECATPACATPACAMPAMPPSSHRTSYPRALSVPPR